MLVNCPKCGFSQPKDRYCASCGIDMALYRPRETPFWKKILGSPLLHVMLIFTVVLASILYFRDRQKEELRARVEYLKSGPVLVERQQKPQVAVSASHQAQAEIARENPTAAATPPAPPDSAAVPVADQASATPPTTTLAPDPAKNPNANWKTADTKASPNRAVVIYAEVDRTVLDAWMDEMRASGQLRVFDGVMMGVLPQASQKIKTSRGFKSLQQTEQVLQPAVPNYDWFVGTHRSHEPENEIGFYGSMAIAELKEGIVRGELEIQRAFRDPVSKAMERVSFGSPFELAPGSAYVMRGLLPGKFVTDLPPETNSDPFLSIFNSRSFANGQTEFTLILEFDTSAPAGR